MSPPRTSRSHRASGRAHGVQRNHLAARPTWSVCAMMMRRERAGELVFLLSRRQRRWRLSLAAALTQRTNWVSLARPAHKLQSRLHANRAIQNTGRPLGKSTKRSLDREDPRPISSGESAGPPSPASQATGRRNTQIKWPLKANLLARSHTLASGRVHIVALRGMGQQTTSSGGSPGNVAEQHHQRSNHLAAPSLYLSLSLSLSRPLPTRRNATIHVLGPLATEFK